MKKIDTPNTVARMMDRGWFTLWHAWEGDDGRVEYWRGNHQNGACVRRLDDDGCMISATHYIFPGDALLALVRQGFEIPGVSA